MVEPITTPDYAKHSERLVVREYIPSRTNVIAMVVCTLFFIGMMIWSVWEAFNDPDPIFIVSACFWGAWTIFGVFCVAALCRMRIFISSKVIQVVDVFRTHNITLAEVTRAVWRAWPPGIPCLVLRGPFGRVVVGFNDYVNGRVLVWFFRNAIPQEVQHRYERFEATHVPSSVAYKHAHYRERAPWWESKWTLIAFVWIWLIAVLSLGVFRVFPWKIVAWLAAAVVFFIVFEYLITYVLLLVILKHHHISCPRCDASITSQDFHSMPADNRVCPHCDHKLDDNSRSASTPTA